MENTENHSHESAHTKENKKRRSTDSPDTFESNPAFISLSELAALGTLPGGAWQNRTTRAKSELNRKRSSHESYTNSNNACETRQQRVARRAHESRLGLVNSESDDCDGSMFSVSENNSSARSADRGLGFCVVCQLDSDGVVPCAMCGGSIHPCGCGTACETSGRSYCSSVCLKRHFN